MKHIIRISLITLFGLSALQAAPSPAKFTLTGETQLQEKEIGLAGGTITQTLGDKSVITIKFEPGCIPKPTKVTLFEVTGTLKLNSGVPGGKTLRIDTGGLRSFEEPMNIQISPASKLQLGAVPVGYAIEADGSLRSLTLTKLERTKPEFTVAAFRPLTFTWVTTK
jgi:hypothetical protein